MITELEFKSLALAYAARYVGSRLTFLLPRLNEPQPTVLLAGPPELTLHLV